MDVSLGLCDHRSNCSFIDRILVAVVGVASFRQGELCLIKWWAPGAHQHSRKNAARPSVLGERYLDVAFEPRSVFGACFRLPAGI